MSRLENVASGTQHGTDRTSLVAKPITLDQRFLPEDIVTFTYANGDPIYRSPDRFRDVMGLWPDVFPDKPIYSTMQLIWHIETVENVRIKRGLRQSIRSKGDPAVQAYMNNRQTKDTEILLRKPFGRLQRDLYVTVREIAEITGLEVVDVGRLTFEDCIEVRRKGLPHIELHEVNAATLIPYLVHTQPNAAKELYGYYKKAAKK